VASLSGVFQQSIALAYGAEATGGAAFLGTSIAKYEVANNKKARPFRNCSAGIDSGKCVPMLKKGGLVSTYDYNKNLRILGC
jgi:hypothetical protein